MDRWATYSLGLDRWLPIPSRFFGVGTTLIGKVPFARDMKVAIWNSQCMLGNSVQKSARQVAYIFNLINRHDVVTSQETRDDGHKRDYFEERIKSTHICF